jgi:predicted Zn-dependent peptidase
MIEDINVTRPANGPTILTDRMAGVRTVTLGFFYRTGARNEPPELNGISHFVEHTVFKGTERRSALDIAVEQDRLGGSLDAFTTHEETGFAIKVIDDQLEPAFDLLADMLLNATFDEKELKSERHVIVEEMKMTEDSPEEYLGELFSEAFFPSHPLGLPIVGTPRSVRTFDHGTTLGYHRQVFTAPNLVIAAAGNVEHDAFVDMVNAHFGGSQEEARTAGRGTGVRTGGTALRSFHLNRDQQPVPAAPILIKRNKSLEQAHLIIATPFVAATDERRYAADLLANAIGGGMSSRLWQKIREERGLAYSVGASSAMYRDCGVFSVFAATSPEQCGDVVDLAIAEIRDIVKNGVSAAELDLAKHQARASVLLSLEDSAARAAALAQSEVTYGRIIPVEETLEKIEAVTADDAVAVAREFFATENVAFAALGDLENLCVDRDRLKIG